MKQVVARKHGGVWDLDVEGVGVVEVGRLGDAQDVVRDFLAVRGGDSKVDLVFFIGLSPMTPDRGLDRALYRQIADIMRVEVDRVQAEGDKDDPLPSENDLSRLFSVTRRTVREAYRVLIGERKVRVVHGGGYFAA